MAVITEEMKNMKRDNVVKWIVKLYSAARTAPWTRNEMYDRIRGQFDGFVRFETVGCSLSPDKYKELRKDLSKEIMEKLNTSKDIVLNDDDRRALRRLMK